MTYLIKIFKWCLVAMLVIMLLLSIYLFYVVYSFDTLTLPKNHGKVSTKLYVNEQPQAPQQALIIGLGGAEGGNAWSGPHGAKQRALLSENGFAFLTIAYFGEEGLPTYLDRISVDAVHSAVMLASKHKNINSECLAVMGVSRGGELALLLGSHYQEYKGVVGIVPGSSVFAALTTAMTTSGFSINGNPLPFVPVPWSTTPNLLMRDLRGAFEKMMLNKEAMQRATIKVENISGPILLMSGTQDEQWPSMEMSNEIMTRLDKNEFPFYKEHIALEGGHNEHHDNFSEIIRFLNENLMTRSECKQQ